MTHAIVRDVMTTRVVSVHKDAPFKAMVSMLHSMRISAFPVIDDDGQVIGVVSAGDLLVKEAVRAEGTSVLAALRHIHEDDKARGITAGELMTAPAVTIAPDAAVEEAARIMYDRRLKRLPVVNSSGRLMGVVSRADVLSVYSRPDSEIREEIMRQALPDAMLTLPRDLKVTVRDGIVTLSGGPISKQTGSAAVDAARHVQGVVAVRDRFG